MLADVEGHRYGARMTPHNHRRIRNVHSWLGMFFAPGIIFFAFSGIFQTLGLHESAPGHQPVAAFIGVMASVHKDDIYVLPQRHAARADASHGDANHGDAKPPADDMEHGPGFAWFKIYALLLAVSLMTTAGLGIGIAMATPATRRRSALLLAAGCVVPLLLLVV